MSSLTRLVLLTVLPVLYSCVKMTDSTKNNGHKWTYLQDRNRLTDLKKELMAARWEGKGEGAIREFRINMYTLRYLKRIAHKDLLCNTGNSAQCYMAGWMGRGFGGEWMHAYIWLSPFTMKPSQHCWSAVLQYKIKSSRRRCQIPST